MGTTFRIVLFAPTDAVADGGAAAAFARIAALDDRLTDYRDSSELSRLTGDAVNRPVRISEDLFAVLAAAQDVAARSGGAFDITVGPLTKLWRRARREVELPAPAELTAARALVGYRLLTLDATARTATLARPGMRLDAGGIAKGFAADQALAVLRTMGVHHALVAAGGDLAVGDPPPGKSGWQVALAGLDPTRPPPQSPLTLARCGVSTSGDAEQWVEIGGVRYSHILDPRTGLGLTGHSSVTVVAANATSSDMLATAVSVLGRRDGARLVAEYPHAAVLFGSRSRTGDRWTTSDRWARIVAQ